MGKVALLSVVIVTVGLVDVCLGVYTCQTSNNLGKRIHENLSATVHDCKDSRGANSCRGGQCVAYVKCSCTQNGNYPPATSCWRPGTKLTTSNGQCNSAIPIGTAVATFGSNGRYYGHAGAFMGCEGTTTIKLLDQWCARSLGVSRYPSTHRYYSKYFVITSDCADVRSKSCRVETAGSSACPSYN